MSRSGAGPRRTTAVALGVVAVLSLASCGDDEMPKQGSRPVGTDTSASGGAGGGAHDEASDGSTGDGEASPIALLEDGAEPRRVLTLDVVEGHAESSTLRMAMSSASDFDSGPPVGLVLEMPVTTEVVDVSEDWITFETTYHGATVPSGSKLDTIGREILHSLELADGRVVRTMMDRSGRVASDEVDYGDQDASEVSDRLLGNVTGLSENMRVVFPDEAIGIGARWTEASLDESGNVMEDVTITYELTGLTDGGYTVSIRTQRVSRPGTVPGGEVVRGSVRASGTVEGRRGLVSPVRATTTAHGTLEMEVGGLPVRSTYDLSGRLRTR